MSLDPLTALGIQLRRRVPTGEAFVDWLLEEDGVVEMVDALLTFTDGMPPIHPFSWPEIAQTVHDLSRGMWTPSPEYIEGLYRQQGGERQPVEVAA